MYWIVIPWEPIIKEILSTFLYLKDIIRAYIPATGMKSLQECPLLPSVILINNFLAHDKIIPSVLVS